MYCTAGVRLFRWRGLPRLEEGDRRAAVRLGASALGRFGEDRGRLPRGDDQSRGGAQGKRNWPYCRTSSRHREHVYFVHAGLRTFCGVGVKWAPAVKKCFDMKSRLRCPRKIRSFAKNHTTAVARSRILHDSLGNASRSAVTTSKEIEPQPMVTFLASERLLLFGGHDHRKVSDTYVSVHDAAFQVRYL